MIPLKVEHLENYILFKLAGVQRKYMFINILRKSVVWNAVCTKVCAHLTMTLICDMDV